ncbi:NADH-quinone oxidoreductase subunit C [Sphingobacterium sp. SG20118]|uniref:NADH-quinone oxidoreductase subunit C n=1 Tax=Sphingobacterium TaxID=28453 RepID=UPI0024699783|nr:NADH-quinone oxidoreductase subunit C [Sphingobacterium faecium]MDH5828591.1 NADH-quinone oxidoreductase subunit C [Sphingobacterium faecium]
MDKLDNTSLWEKLATKFGSDVSQVADGYDLLTIHVEVEAITAVLIFLKQDEDLRFIHLTDITAVHYPLQVKAFEIVYHVHSLVNNIRIRVKVQVAGVDPEIPTATTIWKGANWMERETYDFYGIRFLGHPDLRRILNVDDMEVYPMRKEYPLEDPNRVDKKDLYFGR